MANYNASNERIKRQYFGFFRDAQGQSVASVDAVAAALHRFEEHTRYRDFKAFHYEQAVAFKRWLAEQNNPASGKKLSKATLHSTLAHLKRFFQWLSQQRGYKSCLQYSNAEYFNLSDKEVRVATAKRETEGPTLEQVRYVIANMPTCSEVERRDHALVAFTLLTGARDSAIASMKLKHIDLVEGSAYQDAREVKTKFSKTFKTYFFPVGEDVRDIVADWIDYLRKEKLWGNDDPLFPATEVAVGESRQFEPIGLKREHWSTTEPIRRIFRAAFARAGLPYFNPHSFRKTLVQLGEKRCRSPEEFKAWSQNLGHEGVLTTFNSYGCVSRQRQAEIIRLLGSRKSAAGPAITEKVRQLARELLDGGEF